MPIQLQKKSVKITNRDGTVAEVPAVLVDRDIEKLAANVNIVADHMDQIVAIGNEATQNANSSNASATASAASATQSGTSATASAASATQSANSATASGNSATASAASATESAGYANQAKTYRDQAVAITDPSGEAYYSQITANADAIGQLKDDLSNSLSGVYSITEIPFTAIEGYIGGGNGYIGTSGGIRTDSNWYHTGYISVNDLSVIRYRLYKHSNGACAVAFYDESKNFLEGIIPTEAGSQSGGYYIENSSIVPDGTRFVMFAFLVVNASSLSSVISKQFAVVQNRIDTSLLNKNLHIDSIRKKGIISFSDSTPFVNGYLADLCTNGSISWQHGAIVSTGVVDTSLKSICTSNYVEINDEICVSFDETKNVVFKITYFDDNGTYKKEKIYYKPFSILKPTEKIKFSVYINGSNTKIYDIDSFIEDNKIFIYSKRKSVINSSVLYSLLQSGYESGIEDSKKGFIEKYPTTYIDNNVIYFRPRSGTIFCYAITSSYSEYLENNGLFIHFDVGVNNVDISDVKIKVYDLNTSKFVFENSTNIINKIKDIDQTTSVNVGIIKNVFTKGHRYRIYYQGVLGQETSNYVPISNIRIICGENDLPLYDAFDVVNIENIAKQCIEEAGQQGITSIYPNLSEKTWNAVGDSITQQGKYMPIVKNTLGINFRNIGLGSSTIAVNNTYLQNQSVVERVCGLNGNSAPANADVWTVMAGLNDCLYKSSLGSLAPYGSSFELNTVYGALQQIAEYVLNSATNVKLLFMTPTQSVRDGWSLTTYPTSMALIRKAVMDVSEYYSVPCLDMWAVCGISRFNIQRTENPTAPDGVHPNDLGASIMSPCITKAIADLFYGS